MSTKLKNILRCYAIGTGIKEMSQMFHLSRNTVRGYVRKFQASGMSHEQLLALSESHLQDMFGYGTSRHREPSVRQIELEALLPSYVARLKADKLLTKKQLYEEYHRDHPDGFKDSNFRLFLNQHLKQTKAVGRVEHHAGDQMYVDYAGDRLEIIDEQTGEIKSVEVFVAILPCSHYTYCEATWSQKKEELVTSCENALHFFGGVPLAIVPDNLKSAVTKHGRHEAVINDTFAAFAEHYDLAVYPTRVRKPQDKALVENAVKMMYRTVYRDIDGMVFHDLDTLNASIRKSLEKYNATKMTTRDHSRSELFAMSEKDYLRPLPKTRFLIKQRKSLTVGKTGFITLMRHHYSLPVKFIGKRVDVLYDADTLEIYHGFELVTTHLRDDTPYEFTQKESHGIKGHFGGFAKDLEEIYQQAAQIDNMLLLYLKEVAEQKKYPPLTFTTCRGIMSLEKKYTQERLVAACACASEKRVYSYNEVKEILDRGDDADYLATSDGEPASSSDNKPVIHGNIRGREYYEQKRK